MADSNPEVLPFGEILYDMISPERGAELPEAITWTKAPGGAPANTAVGLARLGISTGFLGGIGNDQFGTALRALLANEGVDVTGAVVIPGTQTRMAYVVTTTDGDRKLAEFTQFACADAAFEPSHLPQEMFGSAQILHFGSISLIDPRSRAATETALRWAHDNGMIVSYDPNVRLGLWPSEGACRSAILSTLGEAHIVKINDTELRFLCADSSTPPGQLAQQLRGDYNIPLLLVTLDARGALAVHESGTAVEVPGFEIDFVEATGAGDAFNAGFLSSLIGHLNGRANGNQPRRQILQELTPDLIKSFVTVANAVGALACTKRGAIPAMPTKNELDAFLASQQS